MSAGAIAVVGVAIVFLILLILSEIIRLISRFAGIEPVGREATHPALEQKERRLSRQAADTAAICAVLHSRGVKGALKIRRLEED